MILLHGFGASIAHWRQNVPTLAQEHTVYALDLLGFGASEKVPTTYGVDLWVEQVYDFWRTFVGRPAIVVGNSIGSLVCLAAAARYPEMVCGVVMLNLPDASVLETPAWMRGLMQGISPVARPVLGVVQRLFTVPPLFNAFFWVLRQPVLLRVWAQQAYATPGAISDELLEIFASPACDRGAARTLRAMINRKPQRPSQPDQDYTAKTVLPRLTIPLLLFWGMQDKMVPPSLARLFLKYNPNLTLIEIANAGHCPHDEHPEQVNQAILDWVTQHGMGYQQKSLPVGEALSTK